jgi:hypothetical protein
MDIILFFKCKILYSKIFRIKAPPILALLLLYGPHHQQSSCHCPAGRRPSQCPAQQADQKYLLQN